jgi:hypothetical protein
MGCTWNLSGAAALCALLTVLEPAKHVVRPITQADTVLTVYREDWGRFSKGTPAIILVAWANGHVVWSRDRLRGGPPYYERNVDPSAITAVLTRFQGDGLFASAKLSRGNFGPDSEFTTILLRSGKKQLKMSSWHELFEARGAVVTSAGIMSSQYGRTRVEALAREPAEYLHFRLIWSETRRSLDQLISASGNQTSGGPSMRRSILSWQEP